MCALDTVTPASSPAGRIDTSEIQGLVSTTTVNYDYLVFAVGAEVQTFNIPGVQENGCFMKELEDAEHVRQQPLDYVYS